MNTILLLLGIVPLIIFVLVSYFGDYKAGIWSAIITGLMVLGGVVYMTGELDETILLEIALVVVFGLIALRMKNPLYFKFQPVVVGVAIAIFLGWFQAFRTPYFLLATKRMVKVVPDLQKALAMPGYEDMLISISHQMIWIVLVHAALIAWAAIKFKDLGWMLTRLSIYPFMIVLFVINSFVFLRQTTHLQ